MALLIAKVADPWVRQMLITFPAERVMYLWKGKQGMFEKVWGAFTAFVKCMHLSGDGAEE